MGVYVVKQGQPWWSGLAGAVAGHFIDGMFERDKNYRTQKRNDANYDAFLDTMYGSQNQPAQPQGLISGAINAQTQDNTTPFSYRPVTLDEMHQTPPASGVVPMQGQGIVATPQPQTSEAVPFQAQTQSVTPQRAMSEDERFLRAVKHLHLDDPTSIIKMALEKRLNNDAAFQHGQRVREAVGDYPVNGSANEQMGFFARNLPLYGDQGSNLVKAFDTAHPGYQMNVVDNGDRKDVVTLDKFSGGVQNPVTMMQGLNPTTHDTDMSRVNAAGISAGANRYAADQRLAAAQVQAASRQAAAEMRANSAKLYNETMKGISGDKTARQVARDENAAKRAGASKGGKRASNVLSASDAEKLIVQAVQNGKMTSAQGDQILTKLRANPKGNLDRAGFMKTFGL